MQVSCVNNKQQVGQGCEIGNAAWVQVDAANARVDADAKLATGFYRPEDLHSDPLYAGPGVRFCWANTGNEGAKNYAEVVCGIDSDPLVAEANLRSVEINRFIEGDLDFNSFDNLAFQPGTGNLYVIEDHNNGDVFACLQDGADRDIKSDGCVKMLSVKDTSAEPTGFMFSNDGRTAYVTIQHSDDSNMPKVDDYATDDLIMVTGFKVGSGK
jgi:secreted PhoX family phosphatase